MKKILLIIKPKDSSDWIIEHHTSAAEALFSVDLIKEGMGGKAVILESQEGGYRYNAISELKF